METALKKVADLKFGVNAYYIDIVQRTILNHLHWHARKKIKKSEKKA